MELTPRKQAVLKAVVKAYIETGEPIGSKILTELLENAPSSATLRNEMSELCELGLLMQPHTSAGRIPTSNGLRLYVDSLMTESDISDSTKKYIDDSINPAHGELEQIPDTAALVLSKLTGLPAVTCTISHGVPTIKRLELLPVSRYSAMLFIMTDDGRTRSRIFRQSSDFTPATKRLFFDVARKHLIGRTTDELNIGYIQSIAVSAATSVLELIPLLTAVCDIASQITTRDVKLFNEGALYNICDDEKTARRITSLVRSKEPVISILEKVGDGVGTVFGVDTGYEELYDYSIVAAKFKVPDKYTGYIGIIGQNRMSYEHIVPATLYTAQRLSAVMTKAQKDMED
ncbi:MAG: heat-inducible transcriptional repressor HrcA [Acutalibacteraceae bacterium]|jgi:heat-inducible transcriptional repressor